MLDSGKYGALLDAMAIENAQVAHDTAVTAMDFAADHVSLETQHGEHLHRIKATFTSVPTVSLLRTMLNNSVAAHARRMPKHQEFAALAKAVA